MASLTVGSNNFPTRVYENPPDLVDWLAEEMLRNSIKPEIEIFDLSHIHQAASLVKQKKLRGNLYIQFVMGVKNAMPRILMFSNTILRQLIDFCQKLHGVVQGLAKIKGY